MKLSDNVSILFKDKVVTDQVLERYRRQWRGYDTYPGIRTGLLSDERVFHALLFGATPFTIIGDEDLEGLVFDAGFKRFPSPINRNQPYAFFGLRLIPKQGKVKLVEVDCDRPVAMKAFSINPDRISVDLDGTLHLEIFYRYVEPQDEILPPEGFRTERKRRVS